MPTRTSTPATTRHRRPPAGRGPRWVRRGCRSAALALVATVATASVGCATSGPGVERLEIASEDREQALDAAAAELDDRGFAIVLRDAEAGRLETDAVRTGSLLDPWTPSAPDRDGLRRRVGATLNHQRRRVRVEIAPVGGGGPVEPDLLGLAPPSPVPATFEVRARAIVEQATVRGREPDTWSREASSVERHGIPGRTDEWAPTTTWTTVGRDRTLERAIVDGIRRRLAPPATADADRADERDEASRADAGDDAAPPAG